MSNKYKAGDKIPSNVLCKRLDELSNAVTKGQNVMREFDMRIPAERDRDADIVLMLASRRIKELEFKIVEYRVHGVDHDDRLVSHALSAINSTERN